MATVAKPIALDESFNTTEQTSRNIADVLAEGIGDLVHAVSQIAPQTVYDLDDLRDVDITSPSNGQVLKYNGTSQKWENGTGGGSGDSVSWTQIQQSGTKIAEIEINGQTTVVYAPQGSGAGAANRLAFKEEITEITDEMWTSIADGTFDKVHVGMHYTAPSGRKYFLADADYFFGQGDTEMNFHHMLVIEDECQGTAHHQTSNVTTGGATSSLIYTTYLPAHQSELEADFGASHIKEARLLLSNAVSNGAPSGWAWAGKKSFLLNMPMVFGHYLQLLGANEMYNGGNRLRQAALFQAMPEAIVARTAGTTTRQHYWCDDVVSASAFGLVHYHGYAINYGASGLSGVRRAFLIG